MTKSAPYPILIDQTRYSGQCQIDPNREQFFKRRLAEAREQGLEVLCRCRTDIDLPLAVHLRTGAYHLQGYGHRGHEHRPNCRFHRDAPENRKPKESPANPGNAPRTYLSLSLHVRKEVASPGHQRSGRTQPGRGARIERIELDTLMTRLWAEAELDQWQERWKNKRTLKVVLKRLRDAAAQMPFADDLLSEHLVIGTSMPDEDLERHYRKMRKKAHSDRVRLLLLGQLAQAREDSRDLTEVRWRNFKGMPFTYMHPQLHEAHEHKAKAVLDAWREGSNTFVIALAQAHGHKNWDVVSIASMSVDSRFLPECGPVSTTLKKAQ